MMAVDHLFYDPEDAMDVIVAIERAFKIYLKNLENCVTVGDLHAIVLAQTVHAPRTTAPCPTALAFRRLRKAFAAESSKTTIRPDTSLTTFREAFTPKTFRHLRDAHGLVPPRAHLKASSAWIVFGVILLVVALPFLFGAEGWAASIALSLFIPRLFSTLPIEPAPDHRTFGDLARVVAAKNMATLCAPHGPMRTADVTRALNVIIQECARPDGAFHPDTRLLPLALSR